MKRTLFAIVPVAFLATLLAGCATPEQTQHYREICLSYGHPPDSPALANCIETKANEGGAVAKKVGTTVLTQSILGAI